MCRLPVHAGGWLEHLPPRQPGMAASGALSMSGASLGRCADRPVASSETTSLHVSESVPFNMPGLQAIGKSTVAALKQGAEALSSPSGIAAAAGQSDGIGARAAPSPTSSAASHPTVFPELSVSTFISLACCGSLRSSNQSKGMKSRVVRMLKGRDVRPYRKVLIL